MTSNPSSKYRSVTPHVPFITAQPLAVTVFGTVRLVSMEQSPNALSPSFSSDAGSLISVRFRHFPNVYFPISIILSGRCTLRSSGSIQNVPSSLVMPSAMSIVSIPEFANTCDPVYDSSCGRYSERSDVSPLNALASSTEISFGRFSSEMPVQFRNAYSRTVLTVSGIVRSVSAVQLSNAMLPTVSTFFGHLISVRELQFAQISFGI